MNYPNGNGHTLRFRDGIVLRANSDFGNAFATALMVAGALTGRIVWTTPASVNIDLPSGVAQDVGNVSEPEIRTFWKSGNPAIQPASLAVG